MGPDGLRAMNIEFQRFHPNDLSFAWNLYESVMKSMTEELLPWDKEKQIAVIRQAFESGNMQLIVFEGERAGWMETHENAERIYLAHIYIKPELQGKGIGGCALNLLIRHAGAARKSLTLSVMKNNPARRFYEKRGFELVGDEPSKYHMAYTTENPYQNSTL